jgi:hypothetical protein
MSRSRKQSEAVTLRYGRHLTHREIAEAVRRTPALRRRATPPTQSDVTRALEPELVTLAVGRMSTASNSTPTASR